MRLFTNKTTVTIDFLVLKCIQMSLNITEFVIYILIIGKLKKIQVGCSDVVITSKTVMILILLLSKVWHFFKCCTFNSSRLAAMHVTTTYGYKHYH